MIIINKIAFQVAWDTPPGGEWGSIIHYLVRIPTFLMRGAITYYVIIAGKWILTNWILVVSFLIGLITLVGITIILIKRRRNNKSQQE